MPNALSRHRARPLLLGLLAPTHGAGRGSPTGSPPATAGVPLSAAVAAALAMPTGAPVPIGILAAA